MDTASLIFHCEETKSLFCVCLTPKSRSLQDNDAPLELWGLISPFTALIAIIVSDIATQYETHTHTP